MQCAFTRITTFEGSGDGPEMCLTAAIFPLCSSHAEDQRWHYHLDPAVYRMRHVLTDTEERRLRHRAQREQEVREWNAGEKTLKEVNVDCGNIYACTAPPTLLLQVL